MDDNLDLFKSVFGDPIPIYHAKETLEPEMIWISSVSSLSSPFDKCYKEYMWQLIDKTNLSIAQDIEPEKTIITMSDVIASVSKFKETYTQGIIQTEKAATAFNKLCEFKFIVEKENTNEQ